MRQGSGHAAQPIPRLRPEWAAASYDGTAEFRLALAFALQRTQTGRGAGASAGSVRRHWLPLDRRRQGRFSTSGSARLDVMPEVVMQGRRALDDAIALVERALVESSQHGDRHLPLTPEFGAAAGIADLSALLAGNVDLERAFALARPLMALNRTAWKNRRPDFARSQILDWPDEAWMAIRLCMLPWPLKTYYGFTLNCPAELAIFRRLASGDATSATSLALRRLSANGVHCTIRAGTVSAGMARLWAAALAFPITKKAAEQFLRRLAPGLGNPEE